MQNLSKMLKNLPSGTVMLVGVNQEKCYLRHTLEMPRQKPPEVCIENSIFFLLIFRFFQSNKKLIRKTTLTHFDDDELTPR